MERISTRINKATEKEEESRLRSECSLQFGRNTSSKRQEERYLRKCIVKSTSGKEASARRHLLMGTDRGKAERVKDNPGERRTD